jgi:stage IV sporulation protein FB
MHGPPDAAYRAVTVMQWAQTKFNCRMGGGLRQFSSRRAKPATALIPTSEQFMFFEPAPTALDLNFRIFGIAVRVNPMHWLFSALLGYPLLQRGAVYLLIWMVCVFVSVLLHEMGHIFMGRLFGSDGHIVLYSFGGLAVPYHHLESRWQRIAVSFAGPLIQLVLAAALIGAGVWAGWKGYEFSEKVEFVWWELLLINVAWPILNLFPIWPLDGGKISRELATWISPAQGVRASLLLSVGVAGVLAAHALATHFGHPFIPFLPGGGIYTALLFGSLAFGSYQALSQIRRPEPWQDDQWPHERQEDEQEYWRR